MNSMFGKWKIPSIILKMEDNLNFFKMEADLNFLKMEDDLNFLKMEDDLIFLVNGRLKKNIKNR